MPSSESTPQEFHTCANCFAEFEWTPFVQDGEEFCCTGCAEGGPCICTYSGAPRVVEERPSGAEPAVFVAGADARGQSDVDTEAVAEAISDEPPQPPIEPPAPGTAPGDDDDEPPTNGRLAIIMAAISEMPLPVQQVVSARLSNPGSDDEIGEPLGLTGDEVRQLLAQGQAILDRTIGSGFRIRYIGAEGVAPGGEPEPDFPDFDDVEQYGPGVPAETASGEQTTELGQMIARSIDTLNGAAAGEGPESERARDVLSEALREVGNLFRIASERLAAEEAEQEVPLRAALADDRGGEEPLILVVENAPEISGFLLALQSFQSISWARLRSHSDERAEFSVATPSMMAFVRDLMAMEGPLRPARLNFSGDRIIAELAPGGSAPVVVTGTETPSAGPRFELAVDSFFGARHFIEASSGAPHHHSYRVESTFVASELGDHGFVVGFAQVRQIAEAVVMAYSETLLNTEEPFREMPPTTENLARVFFGQISERLTGLDEPTVWLDRVRVWENPSNSATYSASRGSTGSHAAAAD